MHRGDLFVAFLFLGVIWLLGHVMWGLCMRNAPPYRLPKQRAPKRTLILTPESKDPLIVGDVPHFSKAHFAASRANVRHGEG